MSQTTITCPEPGGTDKMVVESKAPLPAIDSTQVLVKVAFAGINYIDTYQRSGLYPLPAPHILGREGSGVIEEVGSDVTEHKVGDKVVFLAQGAYSQYIALSAKAAVSLREGVSLSDGCAAMLQGLTAHYLTHSTYSLKAGDVCVIHAGAGGTGRLMIQMAKLRGATVIATCSGAKMDIARSAGADHVIDYTTQDFHAEVMKITDNQKVHVVYDGVGKSTWEKSLACLRRRGMLVLFGNASGPVPPLNPLLLSKNGSLFVTRPTLADYIADPVEKKQRCADLFGWIADKKLEICVASTLPLDKAAEAHDLLMGRTAAGKILLNCSL
eukprot:CAMPEP_0175151596 /NCGR_PEP_ID=MMETSP0087-20121206/18608_1 /TAXON_ID=136419 /ORGANISM="Unknown Unknown, Strain D1" /LENGTH=325 /DNA_ID=CAMNT_0016437859 /DNA_START=66 /DNA_END=1043 /DNA_ORIENTATION=-